MVFHRVLIGLSAALALVIATALPAVGTTLTCGSVLTESVVLDRDLSCEGDALIAGADGITIDLGGHTIRSTPLTGIGVRIEGLEGVTVTNGRIESPGIGVLVADGAHRARVVGVVVERAEPLGVHVADSDGVIVSDGTFNGYVHGILVERSARARISGNAVPALDNAGIRLRDVERTLVHDNRIASGNAPNLWVQGNGNRIVDNVAETGVSDNIAVEGDGNLVVGNVTSQTNSYGISIRGAGNVVVANAASGGEYGFLVAGRGNRLAFNSATENVRDGFLIEDAAANVSANRATDNGELGFHATEPVRGTGNRASGNGDPRQCVNVRCSTGP